MKKICFITIVVFLILQGCSNDNAPEVKVIDGVRTVLNTEKEISDLLYETELEIGEDEDNYIFDYISSFAEDSQGNLYALDVGACNIKKFDSDGGFIKIISQKGSGPSELSEPGTIALTTDNKIIVYDMAKLSFMEFDLDGNFLKSRKTESFVVMDFSLDSNDMIYAAGMNFISSGSTDSLKLVNVYDRDFNLTKSIINADNTANPKTSLIANMISLTIDSNDNLCICYNGQDKLLKCKGIAPELIMKRPTYVESKSDIQVNGDEQKVTLQPQASGITIDENGVIYSMAFSNILRDDNSRYNRVLQVFNNDGVLIGCYVTKSLALDSYSAAGKSRLWIYDGQNSKIMRIKLNI